MNHNNNIDHNFPGEYAPRPPRSSHAHPTTQKLMCHCKLCGAAQLYAHIIARTHTHNYFAIKHCGTSLPRFHRMAIKSQYYIMH